MIVKEGLFAKEAYCPAAGAKCYDEFMAMIHKKIWPENFDIVASGKKRFELRLADFDVKEGDTLILEEWDLKTKDYTGRKLEKKVDYVLKFDLGKFGQKQEIIEKGLYVIQVV